MELDLKNGSINLLLRKMAVPAILAMVVNGLYYLVDAAFVGWGVGSGALAGLAVIFPVQMFTIAWGSMIGMGVSSVVSLKLGENEKGYANNAAAHAVQIAIVSGIVITTVTLAMKEPILTGLGVTPGTYATASEYLGTLQFGFIFVFLSMVGFNTARSQGMAKAAGKGMFIGTLINLALDPAFIFIFGMGVRGAALATVIARGFSTLYFVLLLNRKQIDVALKPINGRFDPSLIRRILFLGAGNFLGQISFSVIALVINRTLRELGTDIDLAVYGILARIHVFITMPLLGLAQGFQPIAGFSYGRGDRRRTREVLKKTMIVAVLMGAVMLVWPLFFPEKVLSLFCDENLVISEGIAPLRTTLLLLPLIGVQIVGFSLFQAVDDPTRTIIISLSRQVIFLVPLLIILPMILNTNGLWMSFPAADALACVLTLATILRFSGTKLRTPVSRKAG